MRYVCCVRDCASKRQDVILHKFPVTNERRLSKWLKCLDSVSDNVRSLSVENLSKLFVCHKHFERRFITAKMRLLGSAYPSLFTAEEISNGLPSESLEDDENVNPQLEHNYFRKRHFDHTYCKFQPSEFDESRTDPEAPSTSVLQELHENPQVPPTSDCASTHDRSNSLELSSVLIAEAGPSRQKDLETPSTSVVQQIYENPQAPSTSVLPGTPKKPSRKRMVQKLSKLSPTCKAIYREYKKAKQQLDFHRRAKRALRFNKNQSFEALTKHMNPYAKKIFAMQVNLCTKKSKGRRFTLEEKIIGLSIMKQSPKCYRFLQKIFILPSKSTLNKMVSNLNVETGINSQVFSLMKKEVDTWCTNKMYCSLIFDEMALETGLSYNKKKDKIYGFTELQERSDKYADHALVFMLRGAVQKWKQPIAYYFCEGATKGPEMKSIIKNVVTALLEIGLKPIALICDQGSAFQSALRSLTEDTLREKTQCNERTDDGVITINEVDMSVIYDPSHLIKGLRNNFLNKHIKFMGKISKWQDIVDVYKTDCHHTEARLLHKLTDEHVIPERIKKMKVKNCVRVFSKTMSAALSYTAKFSHYVDGSPVSSTLKNTAETVNFFDDLFDSVNGASLNNKRNKGKELRRAVIESSKHHSFWKEAIAKLENLKFVTAKGNEVVVPSVKNFMITLKSFMRLWQFFKKNNLKIMRPRYFNSDPIENFFGQVRAYNYRNNDPNCHNFSCTFKSLMVTRVIQFHSETFNCEDDGAEQLFNLSSLFENAETNEISSVQSRHPEAEPNYIECIIDQARRERLNVHSRAYSTGWVVRKILNKIKCNQCKASLTSAQELNIHNWISQREYKVAKKALNYPSESAVRCFGIIMSESNECLEKFPHKEGISNVIKETIVTKHSFDFNCNKHKDLVLQYFLEVTIKFSIINWCNIINKILRGTDVERLKTRSLPNMQAKAYNKYVKKLKNKMLNK